MEENPLVDQAIPPISPRDTGNGRLYLSLALVFFAASLFTVAGVIGNLYFKAAVYECHYGVDDNNIFGLQGYVSENSVWNSTSGDYDRVDDIRCSRVDNADNYFCSGNQSTRKLGYEYATASNFASAGR